MLGRAARSIAIWVLASDDAPEPASPGNTDEPARPLHARTTEGAGGLVQVLVTTSRINVFVNDGDERGERRAQ
jgi:hypothetical protein